MSFEIFQVRTNPVMSVGDLKRRLAIRYKTSSDNLIISHGEVELTRPENDSEPLKTCLKLSEKSIVKVNFKVKPAHLNDKAKVIKVKKRIMQPAVEVIKGDQGTQ